MGGSRGLERVAGGEHCLITGGSSGIGLECAKQLLEAGARVTLVARSQNKLEEAASCLRAGLKDKEEDENENEGGAGRVVVERADVSRPDEIEAAVRRAEEAHGLPVGVLICSAGLAECKTVEDTSCAEYERLVTVNYLGTVNAVRSVLPSMRRREGGRVVLVSSQAGQVGLYGYTAYSPSKFALQGFAQALEMEVRADNVFVSVCYPPDTDTPQYAHENETKPQVTKQLVGTVRPFSAERVAKCLLTGMVKKRFTIAVGFDGWALGIATGVMSPPNSIFSFLVDLVMLPVLRIVALVTLLGWRRTISQAKKKEP